ncbi:bacteriocin [Pseudolactococcus carnosus]|uniref:bacteriocin n=1 Tax=Pseudolactococcus carnosus TaxID=2749961 RepID=UPI000BD78924|nr:bacteriocin [Lactococcus carnosus]SOB48127.1 conserved hypothetical protein [Lactococcus piscium]MCJ1968547.1 bacteriocin [Lactococcus carnosus]MCJ1973511.1 bacteriocin [Lactococcus carnosus]MCJ1981785.1 bacteriocin [Lactococcus carnosus]MCJ1992907.1 bacteriocin [Lactococcus carnosus]
MNKDDVITLSDGQTATIIKDTRPSIKGIDNKYYNNIYIVQLENGQIRVVDKKTLTLAKTK